MYVAFVIDVFARKIVGWHDMARRCEKYGLPVMLPNTFPMNGLRAVRIMTDALDQPWCGEFARLVFAAQFGRGADISDGCVLGRALEMCGVPQEPWLHRAQLVENKEAIRVATDQGRCLGIFGAPSMLVGDELFRGDDRLEEAVLFAHNNDASSARTPTRVGKPTC